MRFSGRRPGDWVSPRWLAAGALAILQQR